MQVIMSTGYPVHTVRCTYATLHLCNHAPENKLVVNILGIQLSGCPMRNNELCIVSCPTVSRIR